MSSTLSSSSSSSSSNTSATATQRVLQQLACESRHTAAHTAAHAAASVAAGDAAEVGAYQRRRERDGAGGVLQDVALNMAWHAAGSNGQAKASEQATQVVGAACAGLIRQNHLQVNYQHLHDCSHETASSIEAVISV
eukprot:1158290-Pelagomonas_calceolata.AAC.5